MKKLVFILTALLFISTNTNASNFIKNSHFNTPFVFVENNVEYAIFKNGEFDFNILNNSHTQRHRIYNVDISFNTGCNYNAYIERNRFGDITRINNTSIEYTYNGKVNRIGGIFINYNRYGYVNTIGNLHINYNYSRNKYACSGYINNANRHYNVRYHHYQKPNKHHHLYSTPQFGINNCTYSKSQPDYQNKKYINNNRYQSTNRNYKKYTAHNSVRIKEQRRTNSRYKKRNNTNSDRNYRNTNSGRYTR